MISNKISRIDNEFSDIAEAVRNGQGYSGKNKFYADFEFGTIRNDGSNQDSTIRVRSNFNEVTEKTEYTISTSNNELNVVVYYYDKNGNFLSYIDGWKTLPYSFTTPENCYKIKALFKNDTDTIKIEDITEIQLELGEKATKYEPPCYYKPREIPNAILDMVENFYKFLPTKKVIDGVCENAVNLPIVQFSIAGNVKINRSGDQSSPNPDYPQDIEVIDTVNLFDESKYNDGNYYSYLNGKIQYKNKDNRTLSQISDDEMITLPPGTYTIQLFHNTGYSHSIQFITKSGDSINNISGDTGNFILTQETELFMKPFVGLPSDAILPFEFNMQIIKGTEKKPYLRYGSIGIEHNVKKDLNIEKTSTSNAGFTFAYDNEVVKLDGLSSINVNSYIMIDNSNLKLKEGEIYKLSLIGDISKIKNFGLKKDGSNIVVINTGNGNRSITFIATKQILTFNQLSFYVLANNEIHTTLRVQLEHRIGVYPISLNGNKLTKVFSLQDTLNIYRSGKVELIKRNDYVDLSTIDEWIKATSVAEGTTRFYAYCRDISQINSKVIISNRFIPLNWTEIYSADKTTKNAISNITQYSRIIIRISNEIASTPDELKEYFKNNKSYAYYQKLNSKIIELPSIDPIQLWEGTNIFSLITNLETDYSVEYVVDKNSLTEKTTEQNVE